MGLIRNVFRKLLDRELGVLGGELDRLAERNNDLALQLATFGERYERLANRVGMRLARAARRGEGQGSSEEWAALLEREAKLRGGRADDDPDDFPDFRRIQ